MVLSKIKNSPTYPIGRFLFILGLVVTIGFLVTDYIGLSRAGFEDPTILSQRNFYQNTANYSAIIILLFFVMSFILRRGDDKYGNSIGFASQGKIPHLSF